MYFRSCEFNSVLQSSVYHVSGLKAVYCQTCISDVFESSSHCLLGLRFIDCNQT
jgi:hypothetical protein